MIQAYFRLWKIAIHESNHLLLCLALCWRGHFYISVGHSILAINTWIVYRRWCIVCYFYASSKWLDVNPRSRDTAVSLHGQGNNGVVGSVYTDQIFISNHNSKSPGSVATNPNKSPICGYNIFRWNLFLPLLKRWIDGHTNSIIWVHC